MKVTLKSFSPSFSETHMVKSTDTVMSLKQKLAKGKIGIPADKSKFTFRGKEMENDKTLGDYGVEDESGINVTITMGGRRTRRRKLRKSRRRKY